jgi:hypothetical protein
MKLCCDDIDLQILENAISNPGARLRGLYAPLLGRPYKEGFLWKRCAVLISEKYLEKRRVGPGRYRYYATSKAARLMVEDSLFGRQAGAVD